MSSNLWGSRADFGANSTVYESSVAEDSPELTQTITGLTPGASYDVYGVYWSDQDENWTLRAGVASGVNTLYDLTGTSGTAPIAGSTQGVAASLAVWDSPPPAGAASPDTGVFVQRPTNPLIMLLGKAGTAVADGSGNLPVFIDDVASAGAARRSWYDGVAYAPAGTVIAATATLDRSTGTITLNNPTTQNFDIKAIHIESAATGALNAATWNAVHNSNANWTITTPVDPPNTPYTSLLEENGGATTISLAPGGGSISFGNVWNKSPYDHVVIWLTMADGTIAAIGSAIHGHSHRQHRFQRRRRHQPRRFSTHAFQHANQRFNCHEGRGLSQRRHERRSVDRLHRFQHFPHRVQRGARGRRIQPIACPGP